MAMGRVSILQGKTEIETEIETGTEEVGIEIGEGPSSL